MQIRELQGVNSSVAQIISKVPESLDSKLAEISTHAMLCGQEGYLQVLRMEDVEEGVV